MHINMFPESMIALSREMAHHPELVRIINEENKGDTDPVVRFVTVLTYCGMVVDGTYSHADLEALADICFKKLVQMRTPLILLG